LILEPAFPLLLGDTEDAARVGESGLAVLEKIAARRPRKAAAGVQHALEIEHEDVEIAVEEAARRAVEILEGLLGAAFGEMPGGALGQGLGDRPRRLGAGAAVGLAVLGRSALGQTEGAEDKNERDPAHGGPSHRRRTLTRATYSNQRPSPAPPWLGIVRPV